MLKKKKTRLLLFLIRASWRVVVLAIFLGSVSGLASIGLIAMIHHTLRASEPMGSQLAWAFVGLCVTVLLTRIVSQVLLIRLSQGATRRLMLHLSRRILEAPLRSLEQIGPHRLIATLTSDVMIIAQALNGIPVLAVSVVTLACGVAYLAWLAPALVGAMAFFLALGIASYQLSMRQARVYLQLGREDSDTLMRHVRSMIEGIKELKIHRRRRQAFVNQVLTAATRELRDHQVTGFSIQAAAVTWGRLLFFVAIGLALFFLPQRRSVEPAALTGYTLTILYLMAPLERILSWLPLQAHARVSLRKIEELGLAAELRSAEQADAQPMTSWQRLELVGVTHAYQRERDGRGFTLGPIDLSLAPGELLFVVGGNGSGKTTLAKLLTGLYTPQAGEIRLDGRPITDESREAFRQLFTVVFAEVALFESLLGMEVSDVDQNARRYLEQLHLDHEVTVENGAFSTTELSKGQRKRLALLTAYLEDRPIYVFDEWAADQDPLFKEVFYRQILPELKRRGKAVLVITHDDRYFPLADRIVTLCEGQITQDNWEMALALAREGQLGDGRGTRPADGGQRRSEHVPDSRGPIGETG
jgi:putative ATP-binding cassette transporter